MDKLLLTNSHYKVEILDETDLSKDSVDIPNSLHHFALDKGCTPTSWYHITCQSNDLQKTCYISSAGSPTRVNEHSYLLSDDALFLAIGSHVCKLQLTNLELVWSTEADTASCFGLYFLPTQDGILVHGECEITRLNLGGSVIWQASGKDIFSEGFQIFPTFIEVIDFNHEKYHIDVATGVIALVNVD